MDGWLLSALVFSPVLGMVVLFVLPRHREQLLKIIGIVATFPALLFALWLALRVDFSQSTYQFSEAYQWLTILLPSMVHDGVLTIGYELGVDGLSVAMILMTAIISSLAAIASWKINHRVKAYFLLFLLMQIGMFGVFTATNVFLFFIFFELTIIPMFFLIGIWGYTYAEGAANRFLIYNGVGSGILLLAFVGMFVIARSSHIPEIADMMMQTGIPEGWKIGLFFALLIAFGIKLPIFPFHSWVLHVHTQAPPAIVMIHAGVLLKLGGYGFIRLGVGVLPEQVVQFSVLLVILGLINLLYGAMLALRQTELKRVLAYSSVSHMGIVLLGIAAFNASGMQGAVFQMISHGFIAALLFLLIGILHERTATDRLDRLSGWTAGAPLIAGMFIVAALANLGLPGMSGFIGEFLAFLGLFNVYPVLAAIGVIGLVLTAVYMLRAAMGLTFGTLSEHTTERQPMVDMRVQELIPAAVLLVCIIGIGIYPSAVGDMIFIPIESMLDGLAVGGGGS